MKDLPETNLSLIARVKDPHDEIAWSEFQAIYRPAVYQLARRCGVQDADAEDLTQRVFLSVAQAIQRWEPGPGQPRFRAWLYRISKNEAIKAISRRKPDMGAGSTSVHEQLHAIPETDAELDEALIREARQESFRWAVSQVQQEFTKATWAMFWTTCVEGTPIAEVAKSHGKSSGAVYIARSRVMQRIKEKVSELTDRWSANT